MSVFDLIKLLTLAFFAFLIYFKIKSEGEKRHKSRCFWRFCIYTLISVSLLALTSNYIIEPLKSVMFIAILGFLILLIEKTKFKHNVFYLAISYVFSYILYAVSVVIFGLIFVIISNFYNIDYIFKELGTLLIVLIKTTLMFVVFKFMVKFKVAVDYNKNLASAGMAIVGITLIIYGIIRDDRTTWTDFILPFSGIVLCGLGLYWWIKKESVTAYNEKSQKLITSRLKMEVELLTGIRLDLEKALHTDSKKLLAYQGAVECVIDGTNNPAERRKATKLLDELKIVQRELSMEISKELCRKKSLPSTGIVLLDAIFDYYNGVCVKDGVDFDLIIDGDIAELTAIITQTQLETLVSNLLDNALNAVKKCENSNDKRIIARLWSSGLSVEDNGAAFSDSVLSDLERCKETLIPDEENGGGIGFVTIFEVTNVCGASVVVSENNGMKSVEVRFDGEDKIIVNYSRQDM